MGDDGDDDLRSLLRVDLFAPPIADTLSRELRAGRACIVRDAFRPELAERIHQRLLECDAWEPHERYRQPYTSVESHGILDRARYPEELLAVERVFGSPRTKALISALTGEACDGDLMLDATLFLPGDHLAPHSDVGDDRSVAFLWQLARDWKPQWGGHFFWCSPPANVSPTFNTLILYRVTSDGYHAVTPVSPWAAGRRLTVNGWWTARAGTTTTRLPAKEWSRGPLREIAAGVWTIGDE